jgi:hypothetical protein
MRTYTFEVVCGNGEKKTFVCEAASFDQARNLLTEFIKANQ